MNQKEQLLTEIKDIESKLQAILQVIETSQDKAQKSLLLSRHKSITNHLKLKKKTYYRL